MKVYATNIIWDVNNIDLEETPMDLPTEVEIPADVIENYWMDGFWDYMSGGLFDCISDWLIDNYDYCYRDFNIHIESTMSESFSEILKDVGSLLSSKYAEDKIKNLSSENRAFVAKNVVNNYVHDKGYHVDNDYWNIIHSLIDNEITNMGLY